MTEYILVGDVHSQYIELSSIITKTFYANTHYIFLGDLFDSRVDYSDSVNVYQCIRELGDRCTVVQSNHQDKLNRYIKGNSVNTDWIHPTIADFNNQFDDEFKSWLDSLPYGVVVNVNNKQYRISHAYFPQSVEVNITDELTLVYGDSLTKTQKSLMLYGKRQQFNGVNARVPWWDEEEQKDWVRVAGHYHLLHIDHNSIVLDGSCGDEGGILYAYNLNTNELISSIS